MDAIRCALTTWAFVAVAGGCVMFVFELWARRRYVDAGRAPRPLVLLAGMVLLPAMVPDAVGLMLKDLGILPTDDRTEMHQDDAQRAAGEQATRRTP